MNEKFQLTFELVSTGDMYRATLNADTPHGPVTFDIPNRDAASALKQVVTLVERTAGRRKPGPKPKNYWPCRYIVNLLSKRANIAPPEDSKENDQTAKSLVASVISTLLH